MITLDLCFIKSDKIKHIFRNDKITSIFEIGCEKIISISYLNNSFRLLLTALFLTDNFRQLKLAQNNTRFQEIAGNYSSTKADELYSN